MNSGTCREPAIHRLGKVKFEFTYLGLETKKENQIIILISTNWTPVGKNLDHSECLLKRWRENMIL